MNELVTEIGALWKSMSKDAQVDATETELVRLADTKEMKQAASHSVPLNAFHDARATLASVENEVSRICIHISYIKLTHLCSSWSCFIIGLGLRWFSLPCAPMANR